jgi:tetratricopeptide (TPR) repeat protein
VSTVRNLVFALIPVAVLWLVIEGGLRLAGVSSALDREDPFVGFEATLPLFVRGEDPDGRPVRLTAFNKRKFFNAQRFAWRKAAGSRRVFCLGGSTVYGRPYGDATSFCGWLRAALPAVEPGVSWEVVNAGGISYASYRVAALVDEIATYEPDLLIVYTGHNEFLEERTYRGLRETPGWRRWLDQRLRSLRSYAVIEAVLRRGSRGDTADRDQLAAEVETRLDSSIGLDAYSRDDELAANVAEHFRFNLQSIVRRGREAGAEVLIVVPADNLSDCAPFKSEFSSGLAEAEMEALRTSLAAGRAATQRGAADEARDLFARAVALDPRHAHARYELGRVLLAEGAHDDARKQLEAARDQDVCPLRARSELIAGTRETASQLNTPQVDFPKLIARLDGSKARPRGANWFLDHVHPTIEGHRILAREILAELHRVGWLNRDPASADDALLSAEAGVRKRIDPRAHGVALRNLAKVLSWAGKTEEAGRAAEQALERLGDDAESFFILALDASELGDHARAVALLRESLRLDPDWVKPRLNLGVELARSDRLEDARQAYEEVLVRNPDHPSVRFNLGRLLARMGRLEEAAAVYRESLGLHPDDDDARVELAWVAETLARRSAGLVDR